jgi:hypothetical protein
MTYKIPVFFAMATFLTGATLPAPGATNTANPPSAAIAPSGPSAPSASSVAELQARVDQEKAELDAIDRKTDQIEKGGEEPTDASNRLSDARASLAALETLKQGLIEQQNQSFVEQRSEQNEFKIDAQLKSNQLKDQLVREQAVAQDLNRRLQEQQAANLNTDEQHLLEAQAPAQERRVAELQERYREFEMQLADDEAQSYAMQLGNSAAQDDLAALNRQIQEQQAVVAKLASQDEQERGAQEAGVAQDEALQDRYVELKRDYDDLSSQLE